MEPAAPLIITLALDERSFAFFEDKRRRFFPPDRNFIPAHLTLFHYLPGEELQEIEEHLGQIAAKQKTMTLEVTGLRLLGRGVAYRLSSPELNSLREDLAECWSSWLKPQDRQKLDPHITVQNKVQPQVAKRLLEELAAEFQPFRVHGKGLDLWWYRGGPWEHARHLQFD